MKKLQFVDTNLLLYSVGKEPAVSRKRLIAQRILDEDDLALSVQVLQEFFVQSTRPSGRINLPEDLAREFISSWRRFKVQPVTVEIMDDALKLRERYGFNYWDSAILAAAKELECDMLYTEDLQHNQVVDGVRVINPFAD